MWPGVALHPSAGGLCAGRAPQSDFRGSWVVGAGTGGARKGTGPKITSPTWYPQLQQLLTHSSSQLAMTEPQRMNPVRVAVRKLT